MSGSQDQEPGPVDTATHRLIEMLDRTEAMYSLEFQKYRLMIARLREKSESGKSAGGPADYTIRPRRAA